MGTYTSFDKLKGKELIIPILMQCKCDYLNLGKTSGIQSGSFQGLDFPCIHASVRVDMSELNQQDPSSKHVALGMPMTINN